MARHTGIEGLLLGGSTDGCRSRQPAALRDIPCASSLARIERHTGSTPESLGSVIDTSVPSLSVLFLRTTPHGYQDTDTLLVVVLPLPPPLNTQLPPHSILKLLLVRAGVSSALVLSLSSYRTT